MKTTLLISACIALLVPRGIAEDIRLGLIGLDTSHVTAFTEILNNPNAKDHVSGAKVVAAFKGGSADIPSSIGRVEEYTTALRDKYGVTIYDTIQEVCAHVDGILIESVDGRPHLEQAKAVIAMKKPMFIDKPLAGSLPDVLELIQLAAKAQVPLYTSSSLRYGKATQLVRQGSLGLVRYAEGTSPAHLEEHHPDLYWYGVHGCESLFTVMGTGCVKVERHSTPDGKIEVIGYWKGGRKGIFRESNNYGGLARGDKGESPVGAYDGYAPLVVEIVKFMQTGKSPVPIDETLELFAFMSAADESKKLDGKPVSLADVLKTAKRQQRKLYHH